MSEYLDAKTRLIKDVQAKGESWDALATSSAVDFARDPDDECKRRDAARHVAISDRMHAFAKEVVDLIHIYWPNE